MLSSFNLCVLLCLAIYSDNNYYPNSYCLETVFALYGRNVKADYDAGPAILIPGV